MTAVVEDPLYEERLAEIRASLIAGGTREESAVWQAPGVIGRFDATTSPYWVLKLDDGVFSFKQAVEVHREFASFDSWCIGFVRRPGEKVEVEAHPEVTCGNSGCGKRNDHDAARCWWCEGSLRSRQG